MGAAPHGVVLAGRQKADVAMRLSLGLEARQVQTQVQKLAPRMIQSMEILQLPIMALQDRIEQEMNENPVLEIQEQDPTLPDEPAERDNPDAPAETEREMVVDETQDNVDDFERLINMDSEAPGTFDDGPRRSLTRIEEEADRKHDAMANVVARPESLNDYLMRQIGEMELEPELAAMAERIISALDASDGGYLKSSLEDLLPPDADLAQLEVARRALEIVQHLTFVLIAAGAPTIIASLAHTDLELVKVDQFGFGTAGLQTFHGGIRASGREAINIGAGVKDKDFHFPDFVIFFNSTLL